MNPFHNFDDFGVNQIEDILVRESLDDHDEETGGTGSTASSYSETFDMMPVYRSIDVMADDIGYERETGLDRVYEPNVSVPPPRLSSSRARRCERGEEPVDDLFALLDEEMRHTSLPCQDIELCGISSTSFQLENTSVEKITKSLEEFLTKRSVHSQHFEKCSLWKCEVTNFVESCKFHIQIYSVNGDDQKFTVEFLRISGCSLLFSSHYQSFKAEQCSCDEKEEDKSLTDVSSLAPADLAVSQKALESFVNWVALDQTEATRAVCGVFKDTSIGSQVCPGEHLSPEEIMLMTLLGATCMQCKDEKAEDKLPMLSLLNLLLRSRAEKEPSSTCYAVLSTMVDSLIPPTARLSASPQASKCVRETAIQMMDINCS